MLFKIDGGPGRLDIKSLAELRVRGIYLFPGVQNTTHIMQETDQNYSEFKSLHRKHIRQLLNDMFAKCREQQNQERQVGETLPSIPTLNRSWNFPQWASRGSGKQNPRHSSFYLPLLFERKNLMSWKACGAVPCTCEALKHHSVQQEVNPMNLHIFAEESKQVAVLMECYGGNFDWASKNFRDIEALNHSACKWLEEQGYNGRAFWIRANFHPTS